MARLIDADALKVDLTRFYDNIVTAKQLIDEQPTVDAAPVVHGRWRVTDAYPHNVYCSECYKTFAQTHWAVWEDGSLPRGFCPNCGAKMDGGEDE